MSYRELTQWVTYINGENTPREETPQGLADLLSKHQFTRKDTA